MSYWDAEAIEAERFDADCEMAELQAQGREFGRARKTMLRLRAAGKLAEAAQACPHGAGYPLNSPAATNSSDPRAGQAGFRCVDCGSVLTGWAGRVIHPCDLAGGGK
jgi:hypothetical protein